VLAIAVVASVAVALFAVPLAVVLQRSYSEEDLLRFQRDTIAATRRIDVSGDPSDPVELPPGSRDLTAYDLSGRRLAGPLERLAGASEHASHQLRTPLAALRLELEAMELRGGDRPIWPPPSRRSTACRPRSKR
jgi:signal transduction histidine kinase